MRPISLLPLHRLAHRIWEGIHQGILIEGILIPLSRSKGNVSINKALQTLSEAFCGLDVPAMGRFCRNDEKFSEASASDVDTSDETSFSLNLPYSMTLSISLGRYDMQHSLICTPED